MTATITDLFCGAGGSSLGAEAAGGTLVMAANHWQRAIEVHQAHFPNAGHDCADISQADPRRYPVSDILLASPECTNHSQARGISRRQQDPTLWDAPDPAAERSRATMWDVVRFTEQIHYAAVVVENVVEAMKWNLWPAWWLAMEANGYRGVVLSHNSMHHGVPQSRDRIYVVWTRNGLAVDLEMEHTAWCGHCERVGVCRQAFKPHRRVGRYRAQWVWSCLGCQRPVEPGTRGAIDIIDWSLPCPRIGDRTKPLATATRARISAGLQRHGWATPITTSGAGNGFERTPGNRARPVAEPVATQTCSGGSAGGNHHALLMRNNMGGGEMITPVTEPARTMTTAGHQSLLVPYYGTGVARPTTQPAPTVTTHDRVALVDTDQLVDDCGFRMLEPYEVAAAMAFPAGYIPRDLTKRDQVKLAGNAVTPPVMQWIVGRIIQALEGAA